MQVVDALYRAGADKRVQGIVACFGDAQQYIALAQVQELRNAVLDFRYSVIARPKMAWLLATPMSSPC